MFEKNINMFNVPNTTIRSMDEFYDEHITTTTEKNGDKYVRKTVKTIKTKPAIIEAAFNAIANKDKEQLQKALSVKLKGVAEIEPLLIKECLPTNSPSLLKIILNALSELDHKRDDLFLLVSVHCNEIDFPGTPYQISYLGPYEPIEILPILPINVSRAPMLDMLIKYLGMTQGEIGNKFAQSLPSLVDHNRRDVITHLYKEHKVKLYSFEIEQMKEHVRMKRTAIESSIRTDDKLTQEEKERAITKALSADGLNIKTILSYIDEFQAQSQANHTGRPSAVELRKLNPTMPDYLKIKLA